VFPKHFWDNQVKCTMVKHLSSS